MEKALLIIDCQNGFMPGGESPVENMPKIIENIIKILNKWKDPVIFTKYVYRASPNPLITINPELCVEGTFSSEIVNNLKPYISNHTTVLTKQTYSAFEGTDLENILKKQNINEIYLTGVTTDCCILSTAFSAYDKRIAPRIIRECVAATDQKINDVSLEIVKSNLEYEFVVSMKEFI